MSNNYQPAIDILSVAVRERMALLEARYRTLEQLKGRVGADHARWLEEQRRALLEVQCDIDSLRGAIHALQSLTPGHPSAILKV